MANCTQFTNWQHANADQHPDAGTFTASCHKIYYRAPLNSFKNTGPIIIGIVSASSSSGRNRRQSIRSTWASNRTGIFFVVAGRWPEVSEEYEKYRDLIWIDEKEMYDREQSVLTYKTFSFLTIVQKLTKQVYGKYSYCFKTDDDSYVDVDKLQNTLLNHPDKRPDYWGNCNEQYAPLRDRNHKWSITRETYPELMYPKYCQGAGYAVSSRFVECAVSEEHIARIRFMPFEDVSVGMLAERCGMHSLTDRRINLYRSGSREEVKRVNFNLRKPIDKSWIPMANMAGTIVQHRIDSDFDMNEHHESLINPNYLRERLDCVAGVVCTMYRVIHLIFAIT